MGAELTRGLAERHEEGMYSRPGCLAVALLAGRAGVPRTIDEERLLVALEYLAGDRVDLDAYRVQIYDSGLVAVDVSDVPISSYASVPQFEWVPHGNSRKASGKAIDILKAAFGRVHFDKLEPSYSANDDTAGDATHLFLHAPRYHLTFYESERCKTVDFYGPLATVADEDHPNRGEARRFLASWAATLKTSGSVGDLKYRSYKSFLRPE